MTRLVVRPHRPFKTIIVATLTSLTVIVSGWSLFEYGRYRAGFDRFGAEAAEQQLQARVQDLLTGIAALREENAGLQRARQVEREAHETLNGSLRTLQDEMLELKEELAFYRGIVSPREASRGLRLQSFQLDRGGRPNVWRYKLVLTQVLKNDTLARGSVEMQLEGLHEGSQASLGLAELSSDSAATLAYQFKYFQNLEGHLIVPEGFTPQRLTVRVVPRGGKNTIKQVYDWPAKETVAHVGKQQE